MAAINDLISQIENQELRNRILAELERMNKQKKFGLVFEEHLPESVKLYDIPVKKGSVVMEKDGGKNVYKVMSIVAGVAECIDTVNQESKSFPISNLVSVAMFGTPIYPYLKPVDSICNAPDSDLWHTLIEADNYHALQLLEYMYAGKVDCIYIDPPYNTGARDWKYNNDYVDGTDEYRHSKWLSFIKRRLLLAKKLLNPTDSILIITIDEKESNHLGCLLEELFPSDRIQMISSVINPHGTNRKDMFARVEEYLYFVFIGKAAICHSYHDMLNPPVKERDVVWAPLLRGGTNGLRESRPNQFYGIFFNVDSGAYVGHSPVIRYGISKDTVPVPDDCFAVFPIGKDGKERIWGLTPEAFDKKVTNGHIKFGPYTKGSNYRALYHLQSGTVRMVNDGEIEVLGKNEDGTLLLGSLNKTIRPFSMWVVPSHDARVHGTMLLNKIFGGIRFTFPKSLYAVRDALRFCVGNKPNALILDFFAGSGTTLHAVNLMNYEDGGHRRCIMITNNEVSADEAKTLREKGLQPGDDDWERLGIAKYVTWPRTVCSIKGIDVNGKALKGDYLSNEEFPMADGFKANAIFFKLGFLNKYAVALGRQLRELLPVLWMKAGAIGPCPKFKTDKLPDWLILSENKMAILIDDNEYHAFKQEMEKNKGIETLYIITDFEREYTIMANELRIPNTYQLYRDYLDNFRINHSR